MKLVSLSAVWVLSAGLLVIAPARAAEPLKATYLTRDGGRVDWSAANHLIAFDRLNKNSFTDLWIMNENGENQHCISCNGKFPAEMNGNPAWHPSGKFIVFQAADPALKNTWMNSKLYRWLTNPGAGVHNNIWLTNADGTKTWQITHVLKNQGVLHPHFSHSGDQLTWAEMTDNKPAHGTWVIRLADFEIFDGEPIVKNIRTLTPGNLQFYETHGFSPDDTLLIFTGMPALENYYNNDIYVVDLKTQECRILTDPHLAQWDEHAHFTPDGEHIVWMSTMGIDRNPGKLFTDYWIMDADGANKRRLTYFSTPSHPEYVGGQAIASDLSFGSSSTEFVAFLQIDPTLKNAGAIVKIGPIQ